MTSLGCFTHSWGTVAMSGLVSQPLDLYLFWEVPPLPEPIATLNTTRSSRRSHLSALFWLSKIEKIVETLVVSNSLNGYEAISTQYTFTPFSGWDRLFMKKEYLSISRLRNSFRYCFLPFRIWENIYEKGLARVFFSAFFSNSLNMKRCWVLLLSDLLKLMTSDPVLMTLLEFLLLRARKMYYVGFVWRKNLHRKHMLSPSRLFSKIIGVLATNGGGKWNQYHICVGSISLLNMALICIRVELGTSHLVICLPPWV